MMTRVNISEWVLCDLEPWLERHFFSRLPYDTKRRIVAVHLSRYLSGFAYGSLFFDRGRVYCLDCGSRVKLIRGFFRKWDPCPSCNAMAEHMVKRKLCYTVK